jgi:hypothetical protein
MGVHVTSNLSSMRTKRGYTSYNYAYVSPLCSYFLFSQGEKSEMFVDIRFPIRFECERLSVFILQTGTRIYFGRILSFPHVF